MRCPQDPVCRQAEGPAYRTQYAGKRKDQSSRAAYRTHLQARTWLLEKMRCQHSADGLLPAHQHLVAVYYCQPRAHCKVAIQI